MPRAIARGPDAGVGGLAELIHHDAVVAVEPGLAGERVCGRDTNRNEYEVGGDIAAVGQPHCRHAFGAGPGIGKIFPETCRGFPARHQ